MYEYKSYLHVECWSEAELWTTGDFSTVCNVLYIPDIVDYLWLLERNGARLELFIL